MKITPPKIEYETDASRIFEMYGREISFCRIYETEYDQLVHLIGIPNNLDNNFGWTIKINGWVCHIVRYSEYDTNDVPFLINTEWTAYGTFTGIGLLIKYLCSENVKCSNCPENYLGETINDLGEVDIENLKNQKENKSYKQKRGILLRVIKWFLRI